MTDRQSIARRHWPAIAMAWLAEAWERAWPALWLPTLIALAWAALALFGVQAALGYYPHWAVNLATLGAIGYLLVRDGRHLRMPGWREAARRVERDSGLHHRPLTARAETQATGLVDSGSTQLWTAHRDWLHHRRPALRPGLPRPGAGQRDQVGARGAIGLVLIAGLIVTGGDIGAPLARAMTPATGAPSTAGATSAQAVADVYVTPPRYTGLAPVYRSVTLDGRTRQGNPIAVPVGSEILVRYAGTADTPSLSLGGASTALDAVDARNFEARLSAESGDRLILRDGEAEMVAWPVDIIEDGAPSVAFAEEIGVTTFQALQIAWTVQDDYGATSVSLIVTPRDDADWPDGLSRQAESIALAEPARPRPEASGTSFQDLTPHPWAGLPVTLVLRARDAAGNTATSAPVSMSLPLRAFDHPIAAAIAEQRLRLLRDPSRAPIVSDILRDLSLRPDRYADDIVVFMGLRTAGRRLDLARNLEQSVAPVAGLLWELALRLEDGGLSLAAAHLRDAQEALRQALEGEASDEQIAELTDDLRRAMDEYMRALAEDMQRRIEQGELPPEMAPLSPDDMISSDRLRELMDRIEELGQSGSREDAQDLLSELQRMMENLELGMMPMPQGPNPALDMLEDLDDLTRAQQELMDRTFQENREREAGGEGDPRFDQDAEQVQEALRRQLGDVMGRMAEMLGDLPQQMGQAELQMRQAEQALGEGQPGSATDPQGRALDLLRQGTESMMDQLAEQFAEQQGLSLMPGQAMPRRLPGQDPLGRRMDGEGGFATGDVEVPGDAARERARSILDELRRRAGERERPTDELDYIDRLLERF